MNLPPPGIFQHLIALHAHLGQSDGANRLDKRPHIQPGTNTAAIVHSMAIMLYATAPPR